MLDKRLFRTLQTYAPNVRSAKFGVYNFCTRHLGFPVEDDFRLLARLPQVSLAVDVGGNWGQSIEALRRFARPAQIISFEPNPELGRRLARRYASSADTRVVRTALSDGDGEMTLFVPSYNGFVFDGLASLDRAEAEGWLSPDRMIAFDRRKLDIAEYRVPITTLDSFELSPDIVKIDVQGLEPAVLRGARATMARSRPVTIVEEPNDDVVALLASVGLSPHGIVNGTLTPGRHRTRNTLFVTDEQYAQLTRA